MAKSITVKHKKRGRPPTTGESPTIGIRFSREKIEDLRKWANDNGAESLSDAIRRLVELGLTSKTGGKPAK
jgi:hypothetical protein